MPVPDDGFMEEPRHVAHFSVLDDKRSCVKI